MLTVRLAPMVKYRAEQYAEQVGVSLNALVALALTEYLDARGVPVPVMAAAGAAGAAGVAGAAGSSAQVRAVPVQRGGRNKKRR